MKMGNIASPWRDDVATQYALQSARLRRAAILRYALGAMCRQLKSMSQSKLLRRQRLDRTDRRDDASCEAAFSGFAGCSSYISKVAMPGNPGRARWANFGVATLPGYR
jgi:hypothetical protein